jgi:KUP system potassium uptake protein
MRDSSAADNPFYLLVPDPVQLPMVILATAATVIASQAVITGAFSMTDEAVRLGYLPRMTVRHTSAATRGQIYIPVVNWALMIAVLGLVLGFRSSDNLASAYGLAVSGTFVITTILITVVARTRWHVPLVALVPISGAFLIIDLSFFGANLTKFSHGAWFPLLIAVVVFMLLMTWARGRRLFDRSRPVGRTVEELREEATRPGVRRVPGTSVYVTLEGGVPLALTEYLRIIGAFRENTIQIAYCTIRSPRCDPADHITVERPFAGFTRVLVRNGFMQPLDLPGDLKAIRAQGVRISDDAAFIVHSSRIAVVRRGGMARWRKRLYAVMVRNASDPAAYFSLPQGRVIEFTSVVPI